MLVILARHGNTFAPGESAVWVGGRTDLPLVEKGRAQAEAIGRALRETDLLPARTIAGPLKRTRETAEIALAAAGLDPGTVEIDERLREIDYGRWEAKSSDDIRAMGDGALLAAWEERGEWPEAAGWPGSQEELVDGFLDIIYSLALKDDQPALLISSNGIFRILAANLLSNNHAAKVATGALCMFSLRERRADVIGWNLTPDEFKQRSFTVAPISPN